MHVYTCPACEAEIAVIDNTGEPVACPKCGGVVPTRELVDVTADDVAPIPIDIDRVPEDAAEIEKEIPK